MKRPTIDVYQYMYEDFTRYINSILRYNDNIIDWGFIVTARKGMVNVCINYVGGYHSRDMFNLNSDQTLRMHKNMFDIFSVSNRIIDNRYVTINQKLSKMTVQKLIVINSFGRGIAMKISEMGMEVNKELLTSELKESENTVLCLDYAQSGMGSNSCGPDLLEKYKVNEDEFEFRMKLIPELAK